MTDTKELNKIRQLLERDLKNIADENNVIYKSYHTDTELHFAIIHPWEKEKYILAKDNYKKSRIIEHLWIYSADEAKSNTIEQYIDSPNGEIEERVLFPEVTKSLLDIISYDKTFIYTLRYLKK